MSETSLIDVTFLELRIQELLVTQQELTENLQKVGSSLRITWLARFKVQVVLSFLSTKLNVKMFSVACSLGS